MALFSKLSGNIEIRENINKTPRVITEEEIIDTIFGTDLLEDLEFISLLKDETLVD